MKTLQLSIIVILVTASSTTTLAFAQVAPHIHGLESPLQQFKSGIKVQDIRYQPLFTLVIKSDDSSSACVPPQTAQRGTYWLVVSPGIWIISPPMQLTVGDHPYS